MAAQSLASASAPTIFQFDSSNVRVVVRDGEPWFVCTDVAEALGYRNAPDASRHLDEDEKGTQIVRTPGGDQTVTIISESGLYALVLRSRKPEARKFAKWVTSEVLPTIRKTGRYTVQPELQFKMPEEEAMHLAMDYFMKVQQAADPAKLPKFDGDKALEVARAIVSGWMLRSPRWMVTFNFQNRMQLTEVPFDAFMVTEADLPKMIASKDAIGRATIPKILSACASRL